MTKPIAIIRTKGEILTARDINNFKIEKSVTNNNEFVRAKMTDLFGFKMIEGSDFKVISCEFIGNNPDIFFNYAFGIINEDDIDDRANN